MNASIEQPGAADAQGWDAEVARGERFEFGRNWSLFLERLDDNRIQLAEQSLKAMLGVEDLQGKRFLDAGSGSGLFSLAARRLGAEVVSFDFDPQSVACALELRRRYFPSQGGWDVQQGSVLDSAFLQSLGSFDIVYSWGVLHHTGQMWAALGNVAPLVRTGGQLFISIYNDQGWASKGWTMVKKAYVGLPPALRWLVVGPAMVRLWGPASVRDLLQGRPFYSWRTYSQRQSRGMDAWRDVIDWVGGYPFEVAKPEELLDFYRTRGFELERMTTVGGRLGCNELIFRRARDA